MNDNKLIAEFMEVHEIMHDGYSEYDFDDNTLGVVAEDELQYHTEWNWLMPVVEKIGDENLLSIAIDIVYDRVVRFTKELNLKS